MSGPLRFRTPHIEELPIAQSRQTPGYVLVAVAGPAAEDPSKNWGTTNTKRSTRYVGGNEGGQAATTARHRTEVEKRIRDLNTDGTAQVAVPKTSGDGGGNSGAVKAGRTSNTKRILASGKTFAHYLDDEEAEIALRGRRDVDTEATTTTTTQRASKTPLARRKPSVLREERSVNVSGGSPAPTATQAPTTAPSRIAPIDIDSEPDGDTTTAPMPTWAEMEALLNAPPLTYNQARSAPPPPGAPPPRKFCEICGYWGRVKCMKCGNMTCSVACKDAHDEHRCLKFYA